MSKWNGKCDTEGCDTDTLLRYLKDAEAYIAAHTAYLKSKGAEILYPGQVPIWMPDTGIRAYQAYGHQFIVNRFTEQRFRDVSFPLYRNIAEGQSTEAEQ